MTQVMMDVGQGHEPLPPSLNPKQAGEVANVSARTMIRLCNSGAVKAVKVGGQWRIGRDALIEQLGLGEAMHDAS
jgi:excisionase family DNA binding protein